MSEQFCDVGAGMTLCYETFGERSDPTVLLIMGLAAQMVGWHEDFCRQLASRGLHVVRFDNRDAGGSSHVRAPAPTIPQLALRPRRCAPYTLADMADDTAGLLRELGLAPAHVVGSSMGGMIAQTLAARHPRLVHSLISLMSNTGSRRAGRPSPRVLRFYMRRMPTEKEAFVARADRFFALIGGPMRDVEDIRSIAAVSYDRDHAPGGAARQLAAVIASGDRTAQLRQITAPTLVIHGTADRLISHSGGRATARAIPGAKLMTVEGMGHYVPRALWPELLDAIADHIARADALAVAHQAA
jgi:pimeloyl-ACP methyl ester carboxylesterase